ncbi:zinc finger, CCHC-type containing protein [Tanacetum coccineum]
MTVTMKHMVANFSKLEKFEGVDFKRWQKKMHFLLSTMSVVYVLNTPIPDDEDSATVEQIRRRNKWENDDYVYHSIIINGMSDSLFDIYQNVKSGKELWDSLEAKYMVDDASSKKFLVRVEGVVDSDKPKSNNVIGLLVVNMVEHNNSTRFNDNKVKRKYLDTKTDPNKKSNVTCWKCEKSGHLKKDCKGGKVGNKANGSAQMDDDVAWLNIVNDNIGSAFMSTSKLNDSIIWHARLGHVHFNRMQDMSKDGLILAFDMDTKNDLCDLYATLSLGNKTYFVTFIDDASRFYVIEPNESVLINSIIESSDAIFDENRFSSALRLSLRIPNGTKDIGVSEVFDEVPSGVTEEVTDEVLV